jgi:hypothetical protein
LIDSRLPAIVAAARAPAATSIPRRCRRPARLRCASRSCRPRSPGFFRLLARSGPTARHVTLLVPVSARALVLGHVGPAAPGAALTREYRLVVEADPARRPRPTAGVARASPGESGRAGSAHARPSCPPARAPSSPRATSRRCARAGRCRDSSRPTTTVCTSSSSALPARGRRRSSRSTSSAS